MAVNELSSLPEDELTGKIRSSEYFKIDAFRNIDLDAIYRALTAQVAGGIFKGVLSKNACQKISDNFWDSPSLRQRSDGVPAYYVGTYHYKKAMDVYLAEAEKTRADVKSLFMETEDFLENLLTSLRAYLAEKGIALRLAQYEGAPAGEYLMRSWCDSGNFALEPHDDGAQLKTELQSGFEIAKTLDYTPVAVNICLQNGAGGDLHYWNYEPDDNARAKLGLLETGYPYPVELLSPFESMQVPIEQGDVYFFNGANIHAVSSQTCKETYRSTISFLMGFIDPKTVIYWT